MFGKSSFLPVNGSLGFKRENPSSSVKNDKSIELKNMDTNSLRLRARTSKLSESEKASVTTSEDLKSNHEDNEHKGLLACHWLDGFAAGAVGSSMLAIQQHHILTRMAAGCTFLMGPYAAYQRRRLRELGGLRIQQNRLREQTNQFQQQNEELNNKLSRLENSVEHLQIVENELSKYAKDKTEVEHLQRIVHRQNEIHIKMKACLRQQILTDIMEVVVHADRDRDFDIEGPELEMLIFRMRGISGVVFHEHRFRAKVSSRGSLTLASILGMIRHLMADDDESNDIFTLKPQDLAASLNKL